MTVRKKLQKIGNSTGLILDRDLLEVLYPGGITDELVLVEVVGNALVIRREDAPVVEPETAVEAAVEAPVELPGLNASERLIVEALKDGPRRIPELVEAVGRSRVTVSASLKRLKETDWVRQTGRDWRLSPAAQRRLETDEGRRFAQLPPSLARLVLALEDGPLTAAELEERLALPRRTVNDQLRRALAEGIVSVAGEATPVYSLTVST